MLLPFCGCCGWTINAEQKASSCCSSSSHSSSGSTGVFASRQMSSNHTSAPSQPGIQFIRRPLSKHDDLQQAAAMHVLGGSSKTVKALVVYVYHIQ